MIKRAMFSTLVFSLMLLVNSARATNIVAGPIVGNVTESSIRVWIQINTSERVTVRAVDVVSGRSPGGVSTDVEGPAPFVADVPVSSLSPDRSYRIDIEFDGKPVDIGEPLVVRTAPQVGEEAPYIVAVTGGIDAEKKEIAGAAGILKIKPQFALMLGDIGKLPAAEKDFPKTRRDAFAVIAAMHESVRNNASMKPVFRRVPCLAVWGERDFGPEGSNKSFVYGRESMFAFRRYWPNPMYGTPEAKGVFFNTQSGDADYFCLDARMQRDVEPGKAFFGEKQLEWLKTELKNSKAAIKIIAAASPMLSEDPNGWASSKDEREEFLAFLQKEKIGGVIFVSRGSYGEIVCRRTKNDLFYPLYEMVSPPLNTAVGKAKEDANRVGVVVAENGFASLNFGGSKIKRFVTLQVRDEKGTIKLDETIFAASLQSP